MSQQFGVVTVTLRCTCMVCLCVSIQGGGGRERCLLLKHTSSCSAHHFVCCYASLVFVAMHHLCLLLCITCM